MSKNFPNLKRNHFYSKNAFLGVKTDPLYKKRIDGFPRPKKGSKKMAERKDDNDFEQIYSNELFDDYIEKGNIELEKLKGGRYYQTYGGGPEGGYVILPNEEIYEVNRSWGKPFEIVKQIKGKCIIQNENRKESLCYGIKIIEDQNNDVCPEYNVINTFDWSYYDRMVIAG